MNCYLIGYVIYIFVGFALAELLTKRKRKRVIKKAEAEIARQQKEIFYLIILLFWPLLILLCVAAAKAAMGYNEYKTILQQAHDQVIQPKPII
ncbi:MAG: hypothetical protein Athens071426_3 [Parcubacteria group bacterium Athens0714_26]|nr:MAG: hypothetical protein Athens101426_239 [Parcubacteria group bacterium Athens1014_26]TSD03796.1 MAG: hypothetical protein Athens071426_3 [Parcubacteria group bacterium Athens0714_26]